jgi:hypothetical protein
MPTSPSKPHVLAQKGSKNAKKTRSRLDLSYPRGSYMGEGRTTSSPTIMSHQQATKKRNHAQESLEIDKEG